MGLGADRPARAPRDIALSREEEIDLAARTVAGDRLAATRLVRAHQRFVVYLAKRYRRHGVPFADLIQEGTVGLLEAIRRFNPERNTRLSTYAVWWIRAAIQDQIVRSAPLARLGSSAARRTQLFGARRGPGPAEPDAGAIPSVDSLPSREPSPEERLIGARQWRQPLRLLPGALKSLSPRERLIIARRFLNQPARSRAAIGRELGLSKERVRQLEIRALARLRALIQPGPACSEPAPGPG